MYNLYDWCNMMNERLAKQIMWQNQMNKIVFLFAILLALFALFLGLAIFSEENTDTDVEYKYISDLEENGLF